MSCGARLEVAPPSDGHSFSRTENSPSRSVMFLMSLTSKASAPHDANSASVLGGDLGGLDLLPQVGHEVGEPLLGDVEGLGAGDAREGDRGELVVVLLVLADDAGLAAQGAVDARSHILLMRARSSALRGRRASSSRTSGP